MTVPRIAKGPTNITLTRKAEFGHRIYKVTWLVQTDDTDGPAQAILCPGLPQYGDIWVFKDEVDEWAWCRWESEVTQTQGYNNREPGNFWNVTFTFSTEPDDKACTADQTQDPLLIPPKLSGSFQKFREEVTLDRFRTPILTSSFERIKGPQVEFDNARPIIKIEMPVAILNLPLLYSMRETVNIYPLWGFPPRCIKLSNIGWDRLFYGTCYVYYKWNLEFEINDKGWDHLVPDEATKALSGEWRPGVQDWVLKKVIGYTPPPGGPNPNPDDPSHFKQYKDRDNERTKSLLNGFGIPSTDQTFGRGAVAVAIMNPDFIPNSGIPGTVIDVAILDGGFGYSATDPPAVGFFGGLSNATGIAVVDSSGVVVGILITSGGIYLSDSAEVYFYDPLKKAPGEIVIQSYPESDFLALGIPLYF